MTLNKEGRVFMKPSVIAKLLVVSAVLGFGIGLVSRGFIYLLQASTKLIWQTWVPALGGHWWLTIIITVIGGCLMGLCVKYAGTNPGLGFEAVVAASRRDGSLGIVQFFRVVVSSFIGLITGASIGPEAAFITLGGIAGSSLARLLKMGEEQLKALMFIAFGGALGVLLSSPIVGPVLVAEAPPTPDKTKNNVFIFACMVSASIGFALYYALGGMTIAQLRLVPQYSQFHPIELVYGLLIGIIGTVVGMLIKRSIVWLKSKAETLKRWPIGRGALAGLIIGIIGVAWPLTMFDGSNQLHQLVSHAVPFTIVTLIGLAFARIVAMSFAFAGGYQGGNIFPTFFIAGAVGLAINLIFPSIPVPVAMMATIASAMFVFTPMPLLTIFLLTELSGFSLIPVMAMALTSTYLILLLIDQKQPQAAIKQTAKA